ncbi:g6f-like [Amphiprion ocellaris]|uniref:g6f-like n=1 Tax=Amphiprion ocellaris TaxID=80972 RepID=UPI0024111FD4|nr:g6f-like [Amphiprion ocellaris]
MLERHLGQCLLFLFFKCVMESGFLTFILVSSFAVDSSHGITGWDDVVVAQRGMPVTLDCTDTSVRGDIAINWMVKLLNEKEWKLALSATENDQFSGGASKASMRLIDPNFQDSGIFSLYFEPDLEDSGFYLCLIKQKERKLKERTVLLAILTVSVSPTVPVPQHSTLRLIASVNPDSAIAKVTWSAPGGFSLKSEKTRNTGTVAKLPQVQTNDSGDYVCRVHPWSNSSSTLFAFNVTVTIDADKVASFTDIRHESTISTAAQAQTSFPLTCPNVQGDYVLVYWRPPDTRHSNTRLVYQYDRWRASTLLTEQSKRLQLAGPPYNPDAGSFSFLLTPVLKDGGLYTCQVFLNDNAFSQSTQLSVMKVKTKRDALKQELVCLYSERSQVKSVEWKHHNKSRRLRMSSSGPGSITTTLPLPITADIAGNYTCTLQLKNGQIVRATEAVILPPTGSPTVTPDSMLPSLSALLLLVPLFAAAVGVLLWRQKHISDQGIEQSLSVHVGEEENIYENPENVRQAPPQGSVYMDLKPRGEDDVYKELERYEQCQS